MCKLCRYLIINLIIFLPNIYLNRHTLIYFIFIFSKSCFCFDTSYNIWHVQRKKERFLWEHWLPLYYSILKNILRQFGISKWNLFLKICLAIKKKLKIQSTYTNASNNKSIISCKKFSYFYCILIKLFVTCHFVQDSILIEQVLLYFFKELI